MAYNDIKVDGVDNIYAADYNTIVTLLDGFIASKAQNNGLASLGADGKVPSTQLPSSILGTVKYQGTWAASSGTYPINPSLGYYYVCSDSGTVGAISYAPTDIIIYNGSTWDKIDNTEIITSVDSRTGVVTLSDLYLGINAKAVDSDKLDNHDATYFAVSDHNHDGAYLGITSKANDSDKLNGQHANEFASSGHNHDTTYLGINAKATDSNLLDGMDSAAFATTGHIHAQSDVTNLVTDMATKAPLASPTFTGVPLAPTATANTNTTQIATTAYVLGQASATTPMKPTMSGSVGTSTLYARADHIHPTVTPFNTLTCSQDSERRFFKDDFSNNTIGQYTLTGAPSIASGVLTLAASEKAIKALNSVDVTGKWECTFKFTSSYSETNESARLYFGSTSYLRIYRRTGNSIVLTFVANGIAVIGETASGYLADNTLATVGFVYDGANYQMYWNGVAVGSATAGSAPIAPSIGVSTAVLSASFEELTYSPSVAHTDPFTSDTEARYMQLSSADITLPSPTGTWAAAIAGDVVVSGGKMTLASTASTYQEALCAVLRSYNFGSGEYEFSFDNNNDGGGGADSCGLVFGYQDILNHYKLVLNDDTAGAETLKLYKVVAGTVTQLGSTADVSSSYTRGNKTWLKLHWDAIKGRFWVYLRDDSGVYPTTPNISDAFSAQFSYGKCGFWAAVTTAGEANLNVDFYPVTIRALSLIGETNVPATETGFYFRDEFSTDSAGRFTTTGTWAIGSGILSCTSAGNLTLPFQTTIGTHTFTPTLADGTHYYYFGGYRAKFVASGGNSCVITLQTTAGVNVGSGSLTVTTTSGAFANPVVITEAATSISITVTGATGTLTPGTTTSTNAYPKFTIGAATSSVDNYSFTGTRYYNQPMLRGAQQGSYWNGTAAVTCTRFTDDFNWDTIGEWTKTGSTAIDITKGWLSIQTNTSASLNTAKFSSGFISVEYITTTSAIAPIIRLHMPAQYTGAYNADSGFICIFTSTTGAWKVSKFVSGVETILFSGSFQSIAAVGKHVFSALVVGTTVTLYWDGIYVGSGSIDTTFTSGYVGIAVPTGAVTIYPTLISINALESTAGNNPVVIGGVPHGARYDVQEYAVRSFTNAVRYGEYRLASAIKTTNASAEDIELYLKNATDSSNITDDASDTVAVALSDTNWANITKNAFLNADDVSDTITIQARRKTAATDNTPACLVDFVELLPIVEVG